MAATFDTRTEPAALPSSDVAPFREQLVVADSSHTAELRDLVAETLLSEMHEVALVLHRDGHVELANCAADRFLCAPAGRAELQSLVQSVRAARTCPGYRIIPLVGSPQYVMAIREVSNSGSTHVMARAKLAWQLSARDASVVEHLCAGMSNKEIAHQLGIAEVSVERYLTRLFRLSKTRSRAELVAAIHML